MTTFSLFDKVSIWPDSDLGNVSDSFNGSNHLGVIIFIHTDDRSESYVVSFIAENEEWDYWAVPLSWLHEPEYIPPKNEFVIECKHRDHKVFTSCSDYEPFKDVVEAQNAVNSHRSNWNDFDVRLTYNGVVIG